ncbi:hypothetical protein [Nostoc sp. ChiVER01]|uniref:hypothetical protein n=1 Tax=Nostoc sp. ChiVER01 TaxID=3075382 RepID=UPI002AD48565|nr:hypothetical protein [Nostoc sp. ChiVER01]MDZ8228162.1 hypothetical protein [Nostoc sp. ChiVER01]
MSATDYTYASGCIRVAGGVGAEVFGDAGKAEAGLFDGFGGESIEGFGVGI